MGQINIYWHFLQKKFCKPDENTFCVKNLVKNEPFQVSETNFLKRRAKKWECGKMGAKSTDIRQFDSEARKIWSSDKWSAGPQRVKMDGRKTGRSWRIHGFRDFRAKYRNLMDKWRKLLGTGRNRARVARYFMKYI